MAGYQNKLPCLGRGLREAKQDPYRGWEVWPGTRINFPASAEACAKLNRHLFEATQSAQE